MSRQKEATPGTTQAPINRWKGLSVPRFMAVYVVGCLALCMAAIATLLLVLLPRYRGGEELVASLDVGRTIVAGGLAFGTIIVLGTGAHAWATLAKLSRQGNWLVDDPEERPIVRVAGPPLRRVEVVGRVLTVLVVLVSATTAAWMLLATFERVSSVGPGTGPPGLVLAGVVALVAVRQSFTALGRRLPRSLDSNMGGS